MIRRKARWSTRSSQRVIGLKLCRRGQFGIRHIILKHCIKACASENDAETVSAKLKASLQTPHYPTGGCIVQLFRARAGSRGRGQHFRVPSRRKTLKRHGTSYCTSCRQWQQWPEPQHPHLIQDLVIFIFYSYTSSCMSFIIPGLSIPAFKASRQNTGSQTYLSQRRLRKNKA